MVQDAATVSADQGTAKTDAAVAPLSEQQQAFLAKMARDIANDPKILPGDKQYLLGEITGALNGTVAVNFALLRQEIERTVEIAHEEAHEYDEAVDDMVLGSLEDEYARGHLTQREREIIDIRSRAFDPNDEKALDAIAGTYADPKKSLAALKANHSLLVLYAGMTTEQRTRGQQHVVTAHNLLKNVESRTDLSDAERSFLQAVEDQHLVAQQSVVSELFKMENGLDVTRGELKQALAEGADEKRKGRERIAQQDGEELQGAPDESVDDIADAVVFAQGGAQLGMGVVQVDAVSHNKTVFGQAQSPQEREKALRNMVNHSPYAMKNLTPAQRDALVERQMAATQKVDGDITNDPVFKQAMLDGYNAILKDNNPARAIVFANQVQTMMEHHGFGKPSDKAQQMGDMLRTAANDAVTNSAAHAALQATDPQAMVNGTISAMRTYAQTGQVTGTLALAKQYHQAAETTAAVSKQTGTTGALTLLARGDFAGFGDAVARRFDRSSYFKQSIENNEAVLEKDKTLVTVYGDKNGHFNADKMIAELEKKGIIQAQQSGQSTKDWSADVVKQLDLSGQNGQHGLDAQSIEIAMYEAGGGLKGVKEEDLKKIHDEMVKLGITDVSKALGIRDIKDMVARDQQEALHPADTPIGKVASASRSVPAHA